MSAVPFVSAGEYLQDLLSSSRGQAITDLNLSCNRLEDAGAKRLAANLHNCQHITHLNLANCGIGDAGLVAVLDAVSKLAGWEAANLQGVWLWGNNFGWEATQKLRQLQQQGRGSLVPDSVVYHLDDGVPHVAAV